MNFLQSICLMLIERLVALAMLILLWPIMLVTALVIRITSKGPVFLTEEVSSTDDAISHIHRFRSTGVGTSAFQVFGSFLRRSAIDELPGFWSAFLGDIRLMELFRRIMTNERPSA